MTRRVERVCVVGDLLADASDRTSLFEDFQRRRVQRAVALPV